MTLERAREPFHFYTQVHLHELTGLKASNLAELLEGIREVPGSVIYYHTHRFVLQHQYLTDEPSNEFAYWVSMALQEETLAERLAGIDICEFSSIRPLRERIVEVIENHLASSMGPLREAQEGWEFHFVRSISFIFPTHFEAHTLREFVEVLRKVTINSIYFHMVEARLRLEKGINDFSEWVATSLDNEPLAAEIARLDPYTVAMEGLREQLIGLAGKHLPQSNKEQPA